MNLYNDIQYDELDDNLKFVADTCGIETVKNILEHLGGLHFYIPKITKLDKFILRKWKESNLKSVKDFARQLNVSETYVRKLIRTK